MIKFIRSIAFILVCSHIHATPYSLSFYFLSCDSTISSGLNSMVAVTMEDIWKPLRKWLAKRRNQEMEVDDKRDTKISKILSKLIKNCRCLNNLFETNDTYFKQTEFTLFIDKIMPMAFSHFFKKELLH